MRLGVRFSVITVATLGIAFTCYYVLRDHNTWDDAYQMSVAERDLAIKTVAGFSSAKARYILQLPIEGKVVSVFVVQDSRTAVFGICRIADLDLGSERFYFHPLNEFKIIHMTSDLAWVNMRKAYALSLPRKESQKGEILDR